MADDATERLHWLASQPAQAPERVERLGPAVTQEAAPTSTGSNAAGITSGGRTQEDSALLCWALVANVRREVSRGPRGQQTRRGTAHFSPGTKVYCGQVLWGDGYEHIAVLGLHRGSRRYAAVVLPWFTLTNWRVKPVYDRAVFRAMQAGLPGFTDRNVYDWQKEDAQRFADHLREREAAYLARVQDYATREVHVWIDETFRGLTRERFREQLQEAAARHRALPKAEVIVQVSHPQVTDDWLVDLSALGRLDVLWLGRSRVTDAALQHVRRFAGLKELSLAKTGVTDAGLPALALCAPWSGWGSRQQPSRMSGCLTWWRCPACARWCCGARPSPRTGYVC